MIPSKRMILHAEPEHTGIQATIIPLLVICILLSFWIMQKVLSLVLGSNALPVACITGLVVGLGISWVLESILKKYWKSGKTLILDDAGIQYIDKTQRQITFRQDDPVYTLQWYFSLKGYPRVGRERRMQDKWFCAACQLMQDDERLILYAFFPPKELETLLQNQREWQQIDQSQLYDKSLLGRMTRPIERPTISNKLLASQIGKYWIAEQKRWQDGIELASNDFALLMQKISQ